ncbi:hypothetical protein I79_023873 [Cricetulus griseus]|uniref:Uncharacterized protein n=1 Tax=Cricetulus griseus TaxID=10029 RepID=G3IJ42_CRIGR|nr:hypothetical protein I79_023873 [Cricetulus griseus]
MEAQWLPIPHGEAVVPHMLRRYHRCEHPPLLKPVPFSCWSLLTVTDPVTTHI